MYMPLYLYSCPSCSITLEELRPASRADDRFNPRARVGRDSCFYCFANLNVFVSIHAPAWGATWYRKDCDASGDVSIHAPAWGATRRAWGLDDTKPFQSTRPRGARPNRISKQVTPHEFQSTRPRGARRDGRFKIRDTPLVSIHAPAWGATTISVIGWHGKHVSIHAPAWGATRRDSWNNVLLVFQSTRPRGARRY